MEDGSLTVDQISIDPDRVGLFVLSVPASLSPSQCMFIKKQWESAWRQAGRTEPPVTMVVPENIRISALADADLQRLGLMRLPQQSESTAPNSARDAA